jgi:hypothetical protein
MGLWIGDTNTRTTTRNLCCIEDQCVASYLQPTGQRRRGYKVIWVGAVHLDLLVSNLEEASEVEGNLRRCYCWPSAPMIVTRALDISSSVVAMAAVCRITRISK